MRWCAGGGGGEGCGLVFFFNDPATTEIYTLSLHDALPIFDSARDCEPVAATTGKRPLLVLIAVSTAALRSSVVSVEGSDVVPLTKMP